MSLLNDASLVLIPSGYKEDKVYSIIPSDGSGDLDFVRGSDGTRINSLGQVERTPWNLITHSEDFTNALWQVYGGNVITANNIIAPNGTLTADKFSTSGVYNTSVAFLKNQQYSLSFYVKNDNANSFSIGFVDQSSPFLGGGISYNFSSKLITITQSANNSVSGYYAEYPNNWILLTITFTTNINQSYSYIENSFIGGSGWCWGAQLNVGALKPYFPTTDRLNVPRLTYENGCPSLLLEKQSTNMQRYSEDLSNAVWGLGALTVTADQTTSPDGTQNADKVTEDTSYGRHELYSNTINFTGSNATSFYIKANGRQYISVLTGGDPSLGGATFDVVNGTVVATSGGSVASVQTLSNGWFRCSFTSSRSGTSQVYWCYRTSGGTPNIEYYTGDGTSGFYIWGAQVEASSYPTSYIKTTSTSVTRLADSCYKTGISSLIGQTEGTIFSEINLSYINVAHYRLIASISDGAWNNGVFIFLDNPGGTSQQIYAYVLISGSFVAVLPGSVVNNTNLGQKYKIAIAYKDNDITLFVNGVELSNDTSSTLSWTLSRLDVGVIGFTGLTSPDNQSNNQTILFQRRLTNTELAQLTTI